MLNVPDDPRTEDQRRADREAIARQVELVEQRRADRDLEDALLDRLVEGRSRREDLDQITVLDDGDGRQLAKRGEALIAAADLTPALRAQLKAAGLTPEPIVELNHVYRVHGIGPDRVARSGFGRGRRDFRPNFVTPMGIVMKALCGPENTQWPGMQRPVATPSPNPIQVAVIDTGISAEGRTDNWLAGLESQANRDELDVLPADGLLDVGAGHGTFCCGVVQWLAPAAEIKVYRALKSDGLATEVDVAKAMLEAVRAGAQILNLSLGFETDDDAPPVALKAAVKLINCFWPHVLMVAAAGNTGSDRPCWPGAFDEVTSVAGLTQGMTPAPWSTHGNWVDCSTIGEGVLSTFVVGDEDPFVDPNPDTWVGPNPWALWTGTSFAAPQITGAVAQMAENDGISPREARDQLLATGVFEPGYGKTLTILPPT